MEDVDGGGGHQRRAADEGLFIEIKFGVMVFVIELTIFIRGAYKEKTTIYFFK